MATQLPNENEAAEQRRGSLRAQPRTNDTRASGQTDAAGAPPSNTAPANYTEGRDGTRILRCGVDSLYITYQGSVREEISARLEVLKTLAQSSEPESRARAVLQIGEHCFEVKDKGRGRFPFVLVDNWFDVSVSRSSTRQMPLAQLKVASELLTRAGLEASLSAAYDVMAGIGAVDYVTSLNRVDLCVDFVTDVDLESIPRQSWVTRADRFQQYWTGGPYSGCVFGQGGDLSCRLYNKTLEIKVSGKEYLKGLWREGGWDGLQDVWRLEFQFRRPVLRDLNVSEERDLERNQAGLWEYATSRWLRLTLPEEGANQSRWPTHPLWIALSQAPWQPAIGEPLRRITKRRVPSNERLFVQGLAPITSFMAREGIDDFEQAVARFTEEAQSYHELMAGPYRKGFSEYVDTKVQQKSRQYNRLRQSPTLQAAARAYRDAKEGE